MSSNADGVTRVRTRLRRGDVISSEGAIVQIVKFENGQIVGRHLGSSDICHIHPNRVQVNLSNVGELEKKYRSRQREHWRWQEEHPVEVLSNSINAWCPGKVLRRFLLAENADVVHDLWFQIVFYNPERGKNQYKQLKYDDPRIRVVSQIHPNEHWLQIGLNPQTPLPTSYSSPQKPTAQKPPEPKPNVHLNHPTGIMASGCMVP